MKSAKQSARENGARSNGPVTPEGKAKSALNAITHGLTSARRVVLQFESFEEYEKLVAGFVETFQPVGEPEICLVEEMANAQWKRRRAESIETALLDLSLASLEPKLPEIFDGEVDAGMKIALAYRDANHGDKSFTNIERQIVRLSRLFQRSHDKLIELQTLRKLAEQEAREAEEAARRAEEAEKAAAEAAKNPAKPAKIVILQNEPESGAPASSETTETGSIATENTPDRPAEAA